MGILNVTPDSFSDGGRFSEREEAIHRGLQMAEEGADILDVGGESTRPGAQPVSADAEIERVIPVIAALAEKSGCVVSVDTTKAEVARRATDAGAEIINDVSALTHDAGMLSVAAESGSGVVLMHMQGEPRTMQRNPSYEHVVTDVRGYLAERIAACRQAGIAERCLAVDPGIGFGKTVQHNLQLLAHLPAFRTLGRPLVIGLSRKSFLGKITGREVGGRLASTLGATAYVIHRGANVIRVHDVKESCDVARVVVMLMAEEEGDASIESNTYTGSERNP
jgi:dihydropteroate synthase